MDQAPPPDRTRSFPPNKPGQGAAAIKGNVENARGNRVCRLSLMCRARVNGSSAVLPVITVQLPMHGKRPSFEHAYVVNGMFTDVDQSSCIPSSSDGGALFRLRGLRDCFRVWRTLKPRLTLSI